MSLQPVTKDGKHGKLYLYSIDYIGKNDYSVFGSCKLWGYDCKHATAKFWYLFDGKVGIEIDSINVIYCQCGALTA